MTPPVRVLLVDDHPAFRSGLRRLLALESGLTVIGEAENGRDALSKVQLDPPDVVLMDLDMPEMDGFQATEELIRLGYPGGVLVLTMHDDRDLAHRAFRCGARGYLTKTHSIGEIVAAIHRVVAGEAAFDGRFCQAIAPDGRDPGLVPDPAGALARPAG